MNQPVGFREISVVLKKVLKERGITYRELARQLKLSESSIKKLFTSDDCSLKRLGEICSVLGISLQDLMAAVHETPIQVHRYTPEQENFLVTNSKAFHVYWKIVYEESTTTEVMKQFGLSNDALFKILRSLDKQNLLSLLPDGKIKFPDRGMVFWENKGPLVELIKREWSKRLLAQVEGRDHLPGYRLCLKSYRMKESTLLDFIKAIGDLELEFARRAYREEKLSRKSTIPVALVSVVAPKSFVERL
jgi:DNA-binding Xre family transcriptional regulator